MDKQPTSRLVVDIPDELHHRLRVRAANDRVKLKDLVTSAIENYFAAKATTTDPPAPHDPTPRR